MDAPRFRQSAATGLIATCRSSGSRPGGLERAVGDCADSSFGRVRDLTGVHDGERVGAPFISIPPGRYIIKFRFQCEPVRQGFVRQLNKVHHATTSDHGNATGRLRGCRKAFPVTGFCAALPTSMVEETLQKESGETLSELLARESIGLDSKLETWIESPQSREMERTEREIERSKRCQEDLERLLGERQGLEKSDEPRGSASHQPEMIKRILRLARSDESSLAEKCQCVYWEEELFGVRDDSNCGKTAAGFYIANFERLLDVSASHTNESTYLNPHFGHCLTPPPDTISQLKPANSAEPSVVLVGIISSFGRYCYNDGKPRGGRVFKLDYLELCPFRPYNVLPTPIPSFPHLVPVAYGNMPDLISPILGYLDLKSIWRTLLCSRQWFSLASRLNAPLWRYLLQFWFRWHRQGLRFSAIIMDGRWLDPDGEWSSICPAKGSDYGAIVVFHNIMWLEAWKLVDYVPPGEYKVRIRIVAENTDWKYRLFVAALSKTDQKLTVERGGDTWLTTLFAGGDDRAWIHEATIDFRLPGDGHKSDDGLSGLRVVQRDDPFAVVEMDETLRVAESMEIYLGIRDTSSHMKANIGLDWFELVPCPSEPEDRETN